MDREPRAPLGQGVAVGRDAMTRRHDVSSPAKLGTDFQDIRTFHKKKGNQG